MSFNKKHKKLAIHIGLFLITLVTTTMAGAEWMFGRSWWFEPSLTFNEFKQGFYFSIPFLAILTVHEFGHYLTARFYGVKVTLPFFIPFPPIPFSIGTMGAVIRIKETIRSKVENFDIGIAGPIAGFMLAILCLYYGFTNLPEKSYIYQVHPDYELFGENFEDHVYDKDTFLLNSEVARVNPEGAEYLPDTIRYFKNSPKVTLGSNLTFWYFENYVVLDKSKIPNGYEIMHYPWLFAGFLALFFTALNLIPVGQLDGGHVVYGLFGHKNHKIISSGIFLAFVFYSGLGVINPYKPDQSFEDLLLYIPLYIWFLYMVFYSMTKVVKTRLMIAVVVFALQYLAVYINPMLQGYQGWLLFALIIGRFLGVQHPKSIDETNLDTKRQVMGWFALLIFIISFSPQPIIIEGI